MRHVKSVFISDGYWLKCVLVIISELASKVEPTFLAWNAS